MIKPNKISDNVVYYVYSFIFILSVLVSMWLLVYTFFTKKLHTEFIKEIGDTGYYIFLMISVFIIVTAALWLRTAIANSDKNGLIRIRIILIVVNIVTICIMIKFLRVIPITDGWASLNVAKYFSSNPDQRLTPDNLFYPYFSKYGNNYFFVVVLTYLLRFLSIVGIKDYLLVLFCINAILLLLSFHLTYLCMREWKGERSALLCYAFLTLNPVSYCLIFWVYTMIISIPLLMGILYCGIRVLKTNMHIYFYAFMIGILLALSYELRPTSCIPAIAIAIVGLLVIIKGKAKVLRIVLSGAIVILVTLSLIKLCNYQSDKYFKDAKDYTYPITHWLMMGSHGKGEFDMDDVVYTESFDDKNEKISNNTKKTISNYKELGISGTISLWAKKVGTSFGNGWALIDIRTATDTNFSRLYQWVSGEKREILYFYAHGFRVLNYLFMLIGFLYVLKNKSHSLKQIISTNDWILLLLILTFLGGVAFYCLWEAKAVYSCPFIPIMMMLTAWGTEKVILPESKTSNSERIIEDNKSSERKLVTHRLLSLKHIIIALVWIMITLIFVPYFRSVLYKQREYVLRSYALELSIPISEDWENGEGLLQDFYADKSFNTIDIYAKIEDKKNVPDEDRIAYDDHSPLLKVLILDKTGRIAAKKKIYYKDYYPSTSLINCSFGKAIKASKDKYTVKVLPCSEMYTVRPLYRRTTGIDLYPGTCKIGKTVEPYDILMDIYHINEIPYCGKAFSLILIMAGTIALALSIRFWEKSWTNLNV